MTVESRHVTVDQTLVTDPLATAQAIASVLGTPAGPLVERLTGDRRFAYVVKDITPEITSAAWLGATYISDDSQRLEAAANERWLSKNNEFVEQAKTYDHDAQTQATARALHLL